MDIPRGSSIITLPPPNREFHYGRSPRLSRSNSQTSSESGRTRPSMAIPGARMGNVPPALPPPRYIHDLDEGVDVAWSYQNKDLLAGKSKLAPIKAGSSLLGLHQLARDDEDEDIDMEMDVDCIRSPSQLQAATGTSIPSLTRRPPSSSGINQRLHGENPLAQHNHNQSTYAYDKHLLLKIGKSNSPPSHSKSTSRDRTMLGPKLSIQTRETSYVARPVQEMTPSSDPVQKWLTSPTPTSAVSPGSRLSWRDSYSMADPRSPAGSTSYSTDPESYQAQHIIPPRSRMGSGQSSGDTRSRSERGSYDSAVYADVESVSDDLSCIGERPRPAQQHGTKRRALSPPLETRQEPPTLLQGRTDLRVAPPQSYKPSHQQSLSSTGSSRYNSYASSNMLSSASSMTSMSSLDTPTSRRTFASPQSSTGPPVAILPLRKAPEPASKMSAPLPTSEVRSAPSRIGNHYICSCCPKKPKKFETQDLLRIHEDEKQYACAYCNNRFKNKNEAERHQNSLHLRKQSWSCAAISTYQAAFYPSALANPRNLATDTCGFCGDEFTNLPPNWDDRIDHLTNVHKFGECNSTKKFFRADHFRQHLKHSHAGKSGKWTNVLENNCVREESDAPSLSPTASEHSQSGSSTRLQMQGNFTNPADAAMSGVGTIDESHEES